MSHPTPGDHRGDLELAQALLEGDPAAFYKLFDLYAQPVFAFAWRVRADETRSRVLAGKILQAVFAHLDAYAGRTSLSAWVLAVARLVARNEDARGASAAGALGPEPAEAQGLERLAGCQRNTSVASHAPASRTALAHRARSRGSRASQ